MLKNKTALITGASRGIGRGIALKFAENGCYVGINYVKNKEKAEEVLEAVRDKGGDGILLQGDVSKTKDVENIVNQLVEERKQVEILVNNAGIYQRKKFEGISAEDWRKILSVNLDGSYYMCKKTLPFMPKGGKIVFVSSQLAFRGSSHGSDYAASKAGQLGLMRSLALELSDKKICVNAVAPGTIDTDIIADYSEEKRRQRSNKIPLGRLGQPEDIANACLFLATPLSDYITGETINVNGGLYIH
ncbi:MAG: SDR family NAD(P)-dependent oxidoreductase [Candidatus Thermoplasmatota archaeon]